MPFFENFMKNNKKKLKKRIRKGITDSLRGEVWLKITGTEKIINQNNNVYNELVNNIKDNETLIPDEEIIIKDLHRTFPRSLLFLNRLGQGQRLLFRILSCFSIRNKKVGYVQGMSFIVGIFLSYMTEEKAFWMIDTIMKNYKLQEKYYPGFPGLKMDFFVLLKLMQKLLPNIFELFTKRKVIPPLYASSWYLTCFANAFPYNISLRILDCYLYEGNKILHRICLGLLALKENEILKKNNFLDIMDVLKTITHNIDVDTLFKKSFGLSISRKKIMEYENLYKDYLSGKKTGDEDIMAQINM
jgi:hypothetical protein